MRTEEKFAAIYRDAEWFIQQHEKLVWIVPMEDDYSLSVLEPCPEDLPLGTTALSLELNVATGERIYARLMVESSKTLGI